MKAAVAWYGPPGRPYKTSSGDVTGFDVAKNIKIPFLGLYGETDQNPKPEDAAGGPMPCRPLPYPTAHGLGPDANRERRPATKAPRVLEEAAASSAHPRPRGAGPRAATGN